MRNNIILAGHRFALTINMVRTIIHRRKIEGISAVLLPYLENGTPDYQLEVKGK